MTALKLFRIFDKLRANTTAYRKSWVSLDAGDKASRQKYRAALSLQTIEPREARRQIHCWEVEEGIVDL
jgi:hypothetical protein